MAAMNPTEPLWKRAAFVGCALLSMVPVTVPELKHLASPIALGAGVAFALLIGNPWPAASAKHAKKLLQASVVGLGFGMSLSAVWKAGAEGIGYTVAGIALTLTLGVLLGRALKVEEQTSFLITAGTSICGGSAIAAVGPAIGARAESMTVSLATVFILNAVALFIFPPIGHALHLSQGQFGVWAAISIHDTSSVVGAAQAYGPEALQLATVLKLARALWIVPIALAAGAWTARKAVAGSTAGKVAIPYFIGFFILAAAARTALPAASGLFDTVKTVATTTLVLTLFLIGSGLTQQTLRTVGIRPLVQGVLLWLCTGGLTLFAIWSWVPA
jgi:uncharacterized integral membrane protein (TIGR00698 family)